MTWRIYRNPSESDGSDTAPCEETNQDGMESVAAPADPLAQLEADVNAAKAEAAEWQDRFLRKAAELENYRKRMEKEKAESMGAAKSSVLMEFLPILDDCERALKSFREARDAAPGLEQYREGVELLYKQLLDAVGRIGVVPIESEGTPFDPHLHEAVSREATAEFEENTVVRELRRGYVFKDRLLRPAQVVVAFHPVAEN